MKLIDAIEIVENSIDNPTKGLSEEAFLFVSRITPMVNVDLLIKDETRIIFLSWRDDVYCGRGWHMPGGIIWYKESFEDRIQKTAIKEVGTTVQFY